MPLSRSTRRAILVSAAAVLTVTLDVLPAQSVAVVEVNNSSDVVNGDTSGIAALIRDPGSDGISFREALSAANGTSGTKRLQFSRGLIGATIAIGSGNVRDRVLELTSGDLTIDGDTNGDGAPDVTLDGTLGHGGGQLAPGLFIQSSGNTIRRLGFNEFASTAIMFSCADRACRPGVFERNAVVENVIRTSRDADAIGLGPWGRMSFDNVAQVSGVLWRDITIVGNQIDVGFIGIGMVAAGSGSSRSRIDGLRIERNTVACREICIAVVAADADSSYHQVPPPVIYSDDNRIENVVIADNTVSRATFDGIFVMGASYGNRRNEVASVRVTGNTITRVQNGIHLNVTNGRGDKRTTDDNRFSHVEIRGNRISSVSSGILVGVAEKGFPHPSYGYRRNRLEQLVVADNVVDQFGGVGIRLWAGLAYTTVEGTVENVLDGATVTGNEVVGPPNGTTTGIEVIAGFSQNGASHRNAITGLILSGNTVRNTTTGIAVIGGQGPDARENEVSALEIHGNTLSGNRSDCRVVANDLGASGNTITAPPCAAIGGPSRRR